MEFIYAWNDNFIFPNGSFIVNPEKKTSPKFEKRLAKIDREIKKTQKRLNLLKFKREVYFDLCTAP